eukprot:INCI5890.6.p1 GENE.INCI5890.6~~INCI5890.6.p1  ORF type:complete len:419 (-),score=64.65 INCI5890.6:655-1911(-)
MSWHARFERRYSQFHVRGGGYLRQVLLVLLVGLTVPKLVRSTPPAEAMPAEPVDDYSRQIEPEPAHYRRDLMYDYAYLKKQPSPAPPENSMDRFGSSFVQEVKFDDSAFGGTHPLAPNEILMFLHIQHTGGTLLSLVLGASFSKDIEICPGSRGSNSFFGSSLDEESFREKLLAWQCLPDSPDSSDDGDDADRQHKCQIAFFHEDFTFIEEFRRFQTMCSAAPMTWLRHPFNLRVSYFRSRIVMMNGRNELALTPEKFEEHLEKYFVPGTLTPIPVETMGLNLLNAYILGQVQLNTVLGRQALIHSPYQFKDRRAGALSVSALRQAAVKLREKTKQRLRAAAARASNGNDDTRRRQLYKLEDEDDYDNDDEALTTAAKRSVGDFYFVGITEEMDASMCLLGVRLGRHLHHRRYLIRVR